MAFELRVTSAASSDLADAHDWYERQSPGLGKEFLRSVDAAFAFIERHPELLAPVHRHLRRALTKRFPYAVYYEVVDAATIRVIGVIHTAMDKTRVAGR
jgi:plasmid stabilization system protein ParE